MWKDENGYVYTEEDLFNMALEECHSEDNAYEYIDNLINEMELELSGIANLFFLFQLYCYFRKPWFLCSPFIKYL